MVHAAGQLGPDRDSFRHPADISVDYRALKNSDTAMALKQQVLPPSLKEFEGALRGVGIDPDKDVEQLTFASYRSGKQGVRVVGVAQGQFADGGLSEEDAAAEGEADQAAQFGYLSHAGRHADDFSGRQHAAVRRQRRAARCAGCARRLLLHPGQQHPDRGHDRSVESGTVWSVLDQQGTQNMLHSALGDAAGLADYEPSRNAYWVRATP